MMCMRFALASMLAVLPVVGSTGCVTKGRFDEMSQQRDSLEARNTALEENLRTADDERASLQSNLDTTQQELALTRDEVASLTGTYDQLVSELRGEVSAGQIQISRVFDGIRLDVSEELLFPSGSASLNDRGRSLLARVASQLESEDAIVTVEGHTDDVRLSRALQQRYPTNWELAGARATSVVRLLAEEGVDPTRLRAVSRGPFAPVESNDTAEGRARNRRTEIILRPVPK